MAEQSTYLISIHNSQDITEEWAFGDEDTERIHYYYETSITQLLRDEHFLKEICNSRPLREVLSEYTCKHLYEDSDEKVEGCSFEDFCNDDDYLSWELSKHEDEADQFLADLGLTYTTVGYSPWATVVFPTEMIKNKDYIEDVWNGNNFYDVSCQELKPDGTLAEVDSIGGCYTPDLDDTFVEELIDDYFDISNNAKVYIEDTPEIKYNDFRKYQIKSLVPETYGLE